MVEIIKRADARDLGLTRYCTGKPCKRGHVAERYVIGKGCVVCVRATETRRTPRGKAVRLAAQKRWLKTPKGKASMRTASARRRRGIEEHELPVPRVAGRCDLCGRPARLHWDHDHFLEELGFPKIETHRGWLCNACNRGLGLLGDTSQALRAALAYLNAASRPRRARR